jgi:hypothetical protein
MDNDNQEMLIRKLLKELPELLADYEHLAPDMDGKIELFRKKRIQRIGGLLRKIRTLSKSKPQVQAQRHGRGM